MEFELERTLAMLRHTPGALSALVRGVGPEWTGAGYGPSAWSVHEIVAHLVFGELTDWLPRARLILGPGESRPFDPFDRAGHAELARECTISDLLDRFAALRTHGISELERLISEAARRSSLESVLDARGRHQALGVVTLRQLLATWVVHDLNHIAQVCKAMAYQYKPQVGPWEQYLSILAPPNPR